MRVVSAEIHGRLVDDNCVYDITIERRRWWWPFFVVREGWMSLRNGDLCAKHTWRTEHHPKWFRRDSDLEAGCLLARRISEAWNRYQNRIKALAGIEKSYDKKIAAHERPN